MQWLAKICTPPGIGMQWGNFFRPININDEVTLLYMFCLMIFHSFVCFIIVWYVENIMPGDFGVPKPWYFPFTVSHHQIFVYLFIQGSHNFLNFVYFVEALSSRTYWSTSRWLDRRFQHFQA